MAKKKSNNTDTTDNKNNQNELNTSEKHKSAPKVSKANSYDNNQENPNEKDFSEDPNLKFLIHKNAAYEFITNDLKRLNLRKEMQESFLKRIFYVFFEARYEDEYGMRTYGLNTDDQLKTILILYYDFIRSQHIEGFDNFLKQLKDQPTLDQQKKINEILMGLNYDRKKTLFTKKKFDLELFGYIEDVLKDVQVYLQDRRELEQYESSNEISTSKSHEFEWCGNKNDLVELVYGLIEAGVLRYTDKKMVVKGFASFLGVNIEDPNTQLQAIKKRKGSNNSQTELLDKMKQKLSLYLNKLT